jgi:hypothetical protein
MNLTSASKLSEQLRSFRGPLQSFSIVKSINHEKGTLRRWVVFSQGKRSVLVQYLWGKFLFDELTKSETNMFWHLSEITRLPSIYLCLKALALGVSKRDLRKRQMYLTLFGLKPITRQQYLTIKGRVQFIFLEEEINLRRTPKFSGYTRHHKDHGSLGLEREIISEVLEPVRDVSEQAILELLTVGKFSLFGGEYATLNDA